MNKYLQKTLEYAAGNFFNKLLLFLLLPIFTRFFIPEEFAVYTNLMIFFTLTSLIVLLGMQQALFSHFYQEKTQKYQFSLISSVYILLIITGIFFSAIIIIFKDQLAILTVRDSSYSQLFVNMAFIIFFNTIFTISTGFLNIMERSRQFAIISSLQNLIVLILIVIFAINKQLTLQLYFHFFTISTFVAAVVSIISVTRITGKYDLPRKEKKCFSGSILSSMLKFGLVMIPGSIATLILQASDRYMLTYLSPNTLYDVGIYSAGYRIGMIVHFLVTMTSLVYIPYAMKIADQPNAKQINRTMYNYFTLFGIILGSFVIIFGKELFYIFIDELYFDSNKIVFAGVTSAFLYGIFNIVNIHFYSNRRAKNITLAVLSGAVLNIILNFILIPRIGIYGAGIASVFAYLSILCINFVVSAKLFQTKYNPLYFIVGIILLGFVAVINYYITISWIAFIIKISSLILTFVIVYFVMRKNDKFLDLWKKMRSKNEIQN
ncbi:MAG: oligosaccharide flippase family protein [Candidatus Cloacimonetes bacterium]|nr:oligosaccharide flippase family protein [Candidatus Cloacimonadota bacterium]MCF7867523.1 oligosaccharide flippase family protein [Candidatus Cloacimonadota bacterium]MCF7882975.1 oligosaccharide flippase family protein [Candidatus Cloacimonadota bacterium]